MSPAATPTVAAVVDPFERARVDAAGTGCFSLVHRESVREALRLFRERSVDAVLVSVRRCDGDAPALLEQFARSFPSVPTVALVTSREPGDVEALLRLGATGVRQVVDASNPAGWRRLREVLGTPPTERAHAILAPTFAALGPLSAGSVRFWEQLVRSAPRTTTVRQLAIALNVTPSTFVSRFVRAGLPSPKDHLVAVRLCHAARLFDEGELTVADVAYRLDYASPQSFGRHLRIVLGITPSEFRARFPFNAVLDRFLERFVRPFRERWRAFQPLAPGRG
ncbi:MAG TPA: helix-turn-helix domain-containing protein [Gemmatimonadales bacterium]|jgi:AraC-like DNA-binding protein